MFGFNIWAVVGVCLALLAAGGAAGAKIDAHFKAIEIATLQAALSKAEALASAVDARCKTQIADANIKAAQELEKANNNLAAAEDALARQKQTAANLNSRLQRALSDDSQASKLSTAVLNYLSLLRGSYTGAAIDAESAANFAGQTGNPSPSP